MATLFLSCDKCLHTIGYKNKQGDTIENQRQKLSTSLEKIILGPIFISKGRSSLYFRFLPNFSYKPNGFLEVSSPYHTVEFV